MEALADSVRLWALGLGAAVIDVALDRLSKDTTVEQNFRAISLLQENGIQLFLDFIMFDAFASSSDLADNVRFLETTQLDSYLPWDHLFNHLTPYLGTAIRKN